VPRRYSLGKRAIQQADTRRRIVDAALELYQEQGVTGTTMQDIARRADVAPGTVANHFGSLDALATEVIARILGDLQMPTLDIFDGIEGLADRIRLLIHELAGFFDRSDAWWRASQREPGVALWTEAEQRFYRELDALIKAALGPLAEDEDAVAVITTVLGTWVIGGLEATGRSQAQAADLVSDLFVAWLAPRAADRDRLSTRG
jgi:AcrR family transcriptional regulator